MTRVWIVDDQLSISDARMLVGEDHATLEVTSPDDESFQDALAREWDLILVDEELWPTVPRLPPQAVDGSSLVACIRAWARTQGRQLPGLVILTSKDRVFADEIPAVGAWRPVAESFVDHEAEMGRTLDVEWLLTKQDENLKAKVTELATAFIDAKKAFGDGGISFPELKGYLKLPPACPWEKHAEATLRRSQPPVTEDQPDGATPQRGAVTVFIWLLQRALAFPGLFVSDLQAAAFLGIKHEALTRAAEADAAFGACIYAGPLSKLVERRWWVPGLDDYMARAELAERGMGDIVGITAADILDIPDPVVVFDQALKETSIASIADSVRINLQGWPAGALQPWMRREDARLGPAWVREMVEPLDRTDNKI